MSTARDRFWVWAHEAGSHDKGWGTPRPSRITPVEAAFYLGTPNAILVRYEGRPNPPFQQYAVPFRPLKQVIWSIVGAGGATDEAERQAVLDLAHECPNMTGVMMDDFFAVRPESAGGQLSPPELRKVRDGLTIAGRRLDLWVVLYTHQQDPRLAPYLELCDKVTLWTWTADQLVHLESNLEKAERLAPGSGKVLGCYMYDYGRRQAMPVESMRQQCEAGFRWMKEGRIEGMIFLASCICDLDLDAVEWTRAWIRDVGDEEV